MYVYKPMWGEFRCWEWKGKANTVDHIPTFSFHSDKSWRDISHYSMMLFHVRENICMMNSMTLFFQVTVAWIVSKFWASSFKTWRPRRWVQVHYTRTYSNWTPWIWEVASHWWFKQPGGLVPPMLNTKWHWHHREVSTASGVCKIFEWDCTFRSSNLRVKWRISANCFANA